MQLTEQVVRLYKSGLSCRDIGKRLGVGDETVRLRLEKTGVQRRPRSHKRPKPIPGWWEYFGPRVERDPLDCLIWTGYCDKSGYGRVTASFAPRIRFSHRLSWFLAEGPFDLRLRILHYCDVPSCVNPDHLFIGTQADNIEDMCAKGRQRSGGVRGEASHYARLTEDQVREIRRLKQSGKHLQKDLADMFGVSPMTISRAVRGQSWSHLK